MLGQQAILAWNTPIIVRNTFPRHKAQSDITLWRANELFKIFYHIAIIQDFSDIDV